jgi:hypothetical protein
MVLRRRLRGRAGLTKSGSPHSDIAVRFLKAIAALDGPTAAAAQAPAATAPKPTAVATPEPQVASADAAGECRYLTVMFCDLVGSTSIAQLDAEEWRDLVGAYIVNRKSLGVLGHSEFFEPVRDLLHRQTRVVHETLPTLIAMLSRERAPRRAGAAGDGRTRYEGEIR